MSNQSRKLRLVHDVLDKLLVDRDGVPLGRVDGIVLIISGKDSRPRVAQIESGLATLARRLNARFARALQWLVRKLRLRWRRLVRIPWSKIESVGRELKLDVCADNSRMLERERWLRDHIVRRIPGNGTK
ncbi:MAG TPA: hypothetical protein VIV62_04515 [Chthoniobacterales bacterium]|jgi:sporulation protein YlmC with PRC-barrel domain